MEKNYFLKFLLFVFVAFAMNPASAQNGMEGKEFWLGFLPNYYNYQYVCINITAMQNTTGTVSIPLQNWSENFTVPPGGQIKILIPDDFAVSFLTGKNPKGILITAEHNITVFAINAQMHTSDGSSILPSEFLLQDYFALTHLNYFESYMLLVAKFDNTEIEITPSVVTTDNKPAGIPFSIKLARGETYLIESVEDISGTKVSGKGECHPFAAFSGSKCTTINNDACDHLFHQLLPNIFLGKEYLLSPVNEQYSFRILAIEDSTEFRIDNGPPTMLHRGKHYTIYRTNVPVYITANKTIMVAQFINQNALGDPGMAIIPPINFNFKSLQLAVNNLSSNITSQFLSIIINTAGQNNTYLNGNLVTTPYIPFPAKPDYAYQIIPIPIGAHVLQADSGMIVHVYGLGTTESYFYSTGISGEVPSFAYDFSYSEPLCANQPVTFNANGSNHYNYKWSFNQQNQQHGNPVNFAFDSVGIHVVTLYKSAPGGYCQIESDSITKFITIEPSPDIYLPKDTFICGNNQIEITAFGNANSFLWSTGDTTPSITLNNAGIYQLISTLGNCKTSDTIQVNKFPFPMVELQPKYHEFCEGQNIKITPAFFVEPQDYHWSSGEIKKEIVLKQQGYYKLTVSNACGTYTDSVYVNVLPLPAINAGNDTTIYLGTFAQIAATGGVAHGWWPNLGLSCSNCLNPKAAPEKTTTYFLTVTGENGCLSRDSVTVMVDTDLHIYIPNIFSPNGDGQNDVLYVEGKGIKKMQFYIYNRWGEKVFESTDLTKGWDGTYKGESLQPAVFVYMIDATLESGQKLVKKGDITLIK
jgi:gliding motility-associated-like protein